MEDSLWPIEDCILVATSGTKIDFVVNPRPHMGDPNAEEVIDCWLRSRVAENGSYEAVWLGLIGRFSHATGRP